jgi:hypothetical protein
MRVLLATLRLFTLATSTHTECAGIAWQWMVGVGQDYGGDLPTIRIAAFQTQAACHSYVRADARAIPLTKEKGAKVTDHHMVGAQVQLPSGTTLSYECWPDTVDPRGPKGK